MSKVGEIVFSNPKGHITIERTGKGFSYLVWVNNGTAATRLHAIGLGISNAFERAKAKLA